MQIAMEWLGGYIWPTAFVLGAIHALQPGHGKTIVAAYLVGTRGTVRDAVMLGVVVTITHTLIIYVLAALAQGGSLFLPLGEIEQYLGAVASVLIVAVGLTLVRAQWKRGLIRAAVPHDHSLDAPHAPQPVLAHAHGDAHAHAHGKGHEASDEGAHSHAHLPGFSHSHGDPAAMTSLSKVFMLGISGGIVPCPEGLAVFLASIAGGEIETGVLLVMVFSLGLAATLVAVGIVFLKASSLLRDSPRASDWGYRIAWISAILITVVGAIYLMRYLALIFS